MAIQETKSTKQGDIQSYLDSALRYDPMYYTKVVESVAEPPQEYSQYVSNYSESQVFNLFICVVYFRP